MSDALVTDPVTGADPIEIEILRHEILSIPNQIERNIERSAFSPLVQEYKDYSVGLVDAEGALVAQSRGSLPIFVANALGTGVREALSVHGADNLRHGDAVLTNSAATLGQHLNNVVLLTPIREGGEANGLLLGFFCVLVHWIDVGGSAPGSSTGTDTTDVWQEGLQLPCMRLLDRGRRIEDVFRLCAANSRFPRLLLGDLEAQLAGCLLGRDLMLDILARRGAALVGATLATMRAQARAAAAAVIAAAKPGVHVAESFLDGEKGVRVPIRVAVRAENGRVHVDLSGLGPQMPGPSNAGRNGGAMAAARIAAKYVLTPQEPVNQGDFDLLDVEAPDGTFLTASADAPIGGSGNTIPTVVDTILKALGAALPQHVAAAHHGTYGVHTFFGRLPRTGDLFANLDTATGGWGATADDDGAFPLRSNAHGDVPDIPAEMQEALYPFLLVSKELRADSGGAGRRRGGLGVEKRYRILAPCKVSLKFERGECPPWGLAGGLAGMTCFVEITRGSGETIRAWKGTFALEAGDRLRVVSGGGGGYGPPHERETDRVLADIEAGYVTPAHAAEAYGVVLGADGTLDAAATEARRAAMTSTIKGGCDMADNSINRRAVLGAGAALLAGGSGASAQAWPSRTIQILVGFGAGGVSDVATRLLAEGLRPMISQPIVIENRAGASGMIAAGVVARSAPDGHMLLGVPGTITIVPSVMRDVQIDVLKDIDPITIHATSPNVMIVKADASARNLQEFIAAVKAQPPEHFAYASSGLGTTVHLMAGMIERAAGIKMRHVPFRSSADSIRSVMAGELPLVFSSVNSALPFIQSGVVRALGIATPKRSSFLPDVATFDEQGLPGVYSDTWFGLAGPAGMPRPLVEQIVAMCDKVMADPAMRARFAALGAEPTGLGPQAARAQMEREVKTFAELATAMGIRQQ